MHTDMPRTNLVRQSSGSRYRDAAKPASQRRGYRHEVEAELEHLREQNRLLRDAALFFGELSERLNLQLREERARRRSTDDLSQGTRHIS
jgi:hypothetical protein